MCSTGMQQAPLNTREMNLSGSLCINFLLKSASAFSFYLLLYVDMCIWLFLQQVFEDSKKANYSCRFRQRQRRKIANEKLSLIVQLDYLILVLMFHLIPLLWKNLTTIIFFSQPKKQFLCNS